MKAAMDRKKTAGLFIALALLLTFGCSYPGLPRNRPLPSNSPPPTFAGTSIALVPIRSATAPATVTPARTVLAMQAQPVISSTAPVPLTGGGDCVAPSIAPQQGQVRVQVYLHCSEQLIPVTRLVPYSTNIDEMLRAALMELLKGPTAHEQQAGFHSLFSSSTSTMLRSAAIDAGGQAVIDLNDITNVLPNISNTTGSHQMLEQLNATVLQFENVYSIVYLMDGSCHCFWGWLQEGCTVIKRPITP
jgi:hypothetical protein